MIVSSIPSPLGRNLKSARERNNLTQEQAAIELGVSARTVSRWETNEFQPTWPALRRAASLYGCTVADLYVDSRDQDRDPNGQAVA